MADISLVIDREKNVFALQPTNKFAQKWFDKNKDSIGVVNIQGADCVQERALLEALQTLVKNDFTIEVWNKRELTELPNTTTEL